MNIKKGFSLLEALIVLVIIGILTGITYPSYKHYISRAHQSDGQTALLDLACRMEAYYAKHDTYDTATIGMGKLTDVLSSSQSPQGWYRLLIKQSTTATYVLEAIPIVDKNNNTLTLNSLGVAG